MAPSPGSPPRGAGSGSRSRTAGDAVGCLVSWGYGGGKRQGGHGGGGTAVGVVGFFLLRLKYAEVICCCWDLSGRETLLGVCNALNKLGLTM